MGQQHGILPREQGRVDRWFVRIDIQPCGTKRPRGERLSQRGLIDYGTARGIDQDCAGTHQGQPPRIDQLACLGTARHVKRDYLA